MRFHCLVMLKLERLEAFPGGMFLGNVFSLIVPDGTISFFVSETGKGGHAACLIMKILASSQST